MSKHQSNTAKILPLPDPATLTQATVETHFPDSDIYVAFLAHNFCAQIIADADPNLKGKPFVLVQQDPRSPGCTVWAASPQAQMAGLHAGTDIHMAKRLCKHLKILPRRRSLEREVQDQITTFLDGYSPDHDIVDSDTYIINIAGTPVLRKKALIPAVLHIASALKSAFSLSPPAIGIASLRLVAAMLSRNEAPGQMAICPASQTEGRITHLHVEDLPKLTLNTRNALDMYGLKTLGQIQKLNKASLTQRFGREGDRLFHLCRGTDTVESKKHIPRPEIETILDADINDNRLLRKQVRLTTDKLCYSLKRARLGVRSLTLILRYTDNKRTTQWIRLPTITNDFLTIAGLAESAFQAAYTRRAALKSIVLRASRPKQESSQLDLFHTRDIQKQDDIGRCVTAIRNKNNFEAIVTAADLEPMEK